MYERHKKELRVGIETLVNLLLADQGSATVDFADLEDSLTAVIKPVDKESAALVISKNGSGIQSLRKIMTLAARRRGLKVYISVKDYLPHEDVGV